MIRITVLEGRRAIAQRKWNAVPAVSDLIEIDSAIPNKPDLYRVLKIVWRRESDDCAVDLYCLKMV